MTMDKYSQDNDMLLRQLQDEEHQLLQKVSRYMSQPAKTASDESDMAAADSRLIQVRSKITELLQSQKQNP